jgi:hypothetical protein
LFAMFERMTGRKVSHLERCLNILGLNWQGYG